MRILELSSELGAAAYCGKQFARWGHEVLRVECDAAGEREQAAAIYLNGGKRRTSLDYRNASERTAIADLASTCDILVTDASAADVETYELLELGAEKGPIVRLSITPFGLSGPYSEAPATEASLLALGGYTYLMGDPDRPPLTFVGRFASYQAGTFAYASALASALAFSGRREPVRIEVSTMECLASLHQTTYSKWLETQQIRARNGNRLDSSANSLLPTRDGWVGVSFLQQFWFAFATMIGRPELADDGLLGTASGRAEHYDELMRVVDAYFQTRETQELFDEAQRTWRVPVGKLIGVLEALDDPHLEARDFWRPLSLPSEDAAQLRVPGSPFRIIGDPMPMELPLSPPERVNDLRGARPEREPSAETTIESAADLPAVSRPLEGIRVLDLTRVWAGPTAARILGDLGADVIHIEAPTNRGPSSVPVGTRGYLFDEGDPSPWNHQTVFNQLHRNRRSVCLDLKTTAGRDVFLRLVAEADVVLENFSARAMSRLELDYEVLREANEQIIYVPMPAFGRSGPYRDYVGLGTSVEPLAAIPSVFGYEGAQPHTAAIAIPDPMAGTTAVAAVVTALERRSRTGQGCELDFSQQEVSIGFIGEYFIEAQLTGHDPVRIGNGHRTFCPHGIYRCAGDDHWIAIATRNEDEWQALCRVANEGWDRDPRFVTQEQRRRHQDELDELLGAWTESRDKHVLMGELMAAAVPAGAVLKAPELMADEHLTARGYFVDLIHPVTGDYRYDGSPLVVDGQRGYDRWLAPPAMGEHNYDVLHDLLGLSQTEIEALEQGGVLWDHPPE